MPPLSYRLLTTTQVGKICSNSCLLFALLYIYYLLITCIHHWQSAPTLDGGYPGFYMMSEMLEEFMKIFNHFSSTVARIQIVPTVFIAVWCGRTNRRPKNGIGANFMIFWMAFWYWRNLDSGGLWGCTNKSFSPNEITGTKDALKKCRIVFWQ